MNKKVLAFVFDGKRFLALRNNPDDPAHGGDFWFTVTGSVEDREKENEAVMREVKEETGLEVKEIFNLNWSSVYSWGGQDHSEANVIAFVKKGAPKMNEEHVGFEWLSLKDFVNRIKWEADKNVLKNVLEKGIKKERFFKEKRTEDYRK